MSNAKMEIKYVGPAAAEQLISNINNALDTKQPKGDYLLSSELSSAVESALAAAKASGEFNGEDGPQGPQGIQGLTGNGIVSISIEEV